MIKLPRPPKSPQESSLSMKLLILTFVNSLRRFHFLMFGFWFNSIYFSIFMSLYTKPLFLRILLYRLASRYDEIQTICSLPFLSSNKCLFFVLDRDHIYYLFFLSFFFRVPFWDACHLGHLSSLGFPLLIAWLIYMLKLWENTTI